MAPPRTVLLIDDDPCIAADCRDACAQIGFATVVESNRAEVIRLTASRPFAAVLYQVMLLGEWRRPDDDVRFLKSLVGPAVPIIVLSGTLEYEAEQALLAAGAAKRLEIPFGPEDIVYWLRRLCGGTSTS